MAAGLVDRVVQELSLDSLAVVNHCWSLSSAATEDLWLKRQVDTECYSTHKWHLPAILRSQPHKQSIVLHHPGHLQGQTAPVFLLGLGANTQW